MPAHRFSFSCSELQTFQFFWDFCRLSFAKLLLLEGLTFWWSRLIALTLTLTLGSCISLVNTSSNGGGLPLSAIKLPLNSAAIKLKISRSAFKICVRFRPWPDSCTNEPMSLSSHTWQGCQDKRWTSSNAKCLRCSAKKSLSSVDVSTSFMLLVAADLNEPCSMVMICLDFCFDSDWISISLEWHFVGPMYVKAPVSTIWKAKSIKLWAGCWSGLWRRPVILFFCASNLVCFSIKGSFFTGSAESVLIAFVFMSFSKYVQDSKWSLLTVATSPRVGVPYNVSANFVISASETWFCGEPTEKANVENVVRFCASAFSARPGCSCSHRFLKALSESTNAML